MAEVVPSSGTGEGEGSASDDGEGSVGASASTRGELAALGPFPVENEEAKASSSTEDSVQVEAVPVQFGISLGGCVETGAATGAGSAARGEAGLDPGKITRSYGSSKEIEIE